MIVSVPPSSSLLAFHDVVLGLGMFVVASVLLLFVAWVIGR